METSGESEFTLAATGDSLITRRISVHNEEEFLSLVKILRDADAAYTNLETLIHDYEFYPSAESGGTWMRSPRYIVDELKWAGFDLLSYANNHVMDYSYGGLFNTMRILDESGLVYAGVGKNLREAREPRYLETKRGRVAVLSVCSTFNECNRAGEAKADLQGRPGLNPLRFYYAVDSETFKELQSLFSKLGLWVEQVGDYFQFHRPGPVYVLNKFVIEDKPGVHAVANKSDVEGNIRSIKDAKKRADYVLVAFHGHECNLDREIPADFMPPFARACIEAGADVFIGHGPHVLRGIEIYRERPIFYSLGNFIFQSETTTRLPADFYERFGVCDELAAADAFDVRRNRRQLILPYNRQDVDWRALYYESVVALCTYRDRRLSELKLYPITLGYDKPPSQRGRPMLAVGKMAERIVEHQSELSSQFGTNIKYEDGIGTLKL